MACDGGDSVSTAASLKAPAATSPRPRQDTDPELADYLVVLRDPGLSHRGGYQIPEGLLISIFGLDFLGSRETEMGIIQGPRCLIVPFRIGLPKEFRNRMSALSKETTIRCIPTSVGYTVSVEKRDKLDERLEDGIQLDWILAFVRMDLGLAIGR